MNPTPITFTQGDYAILNLSATDGNGNPINITGATFSTQIKGTNGVINTFGNGQHAIVNAVAGLFTLILSSTDSANCGLGLHKEILTQVTIGGNPVTFRGRNILTVLSAVPLQ